MKSALKFKMSSEDSINKFDKYRDQFNSALPLLLNEVLSEDEKNPEIESAIKWLRNVSNHI